MACFLVPVAEAAVVSAVTRSCERAHHSSQVIDAVPWVRKLRWLNYLLLGGSVFLAFEHVWHGEIVPWFPFFTSASNPTDLTAMLKEMCTVGVAMAGFITIVWLAMCLVADAIVRRSTVSEV